MKPWNAWVACLGCAGLSLALVGCGGSSVPDPESDANAAQAPVPPQPSAPPVIAQNEPAAEVPEPSADTPAPAPAPEPAPAPAPESAPAPEVAEAAPATPPPAEPAANPGSLAMNTAPAPGATPESTPPADAGAGTPATPAPTTPAPAAEGTPAATPAPAGEEANPFAVFSENKPSPAPAPATPAPAPGAMPAESAETGNVDTASETSTAEPESTEDRLSYLNAEGTEDRSGEKGDYHTPWGGATAFLKALETKDVEKIAEATALRAPLEAGTQNQRLFQALLDKNLAEEDLAVLAQKLEGFKVSGMNQAKSTGKVGITVSKMKGTTYVRRTITMRHEKAGWKVLDISGEGELKRPMMLRGRTRRR